MNDTDASKLIDETLAARTGQLECLAGKISRKRSFRLEEKIRQERAELETLFDLQKRKREIRNQYSLILDSAYFEQKLLPPLSQ